jgi:hypothetical protein
MSNLVWPHRVLGYGATINDAKKLGREISAIFGNDPKDWLKYGRFEIKKERKEPGGLEALCIPMNNDRFRFVIFVGKDDHPLRSNFLICHEVAHTFFYIRRKNERPARAIRSNLFRASISASNENDWEEDFCDAFSKSVTGHNYKDVGLSKKGD